VGISFHGIRKDTVEKAMGINYDLTLRRIKGFIQKAKARRDIKDFAMVTFLCHQYLTKEEKVETFEFWQSQGIERISYFDGPISRAGNVIGLPQARHKKIGGCMSIWADEMIHIVENGNAILCCMDWEREEVLGNVKEQTIYEIWNSARYANVRDKRDGKADSDEDFICKRCEAAITEMPPLISESAFFPGTDFVAPVSVNEAISAQAYDVCLVSLPPWGTLDPPIGLGFLDTYLRKNGLSVKILDLNIRFFNAADGIYKYLWHVENKNFWSNEKTYPLVERIFRREIERAVREILSCKTNLIGFSVVDPKERITIEVIRRIKQAAPEKKIILGGPACSTEMQRNFFIDNLDKQIDYFVVGEGEGTLCEIVENEKAGNSAKAVSGVAYKKSEGWAYSPREPMSPLDEISFPEYRGFDLSSYSGDKSFLVEWSRGCIGRCSFCKNYRLTKGYRSRSADSIIKEIQFLKNSLGVNEFTVCDNLMNGDIAQLSEVCDKIMRLGLFLRWSGQIAPRKEMSEELFIKMFSAGCHKIQIGLESGSEEVLRRMKKFYIAAIAQENLRAAKKAGMETQIFVMIGFPGETSGEFKKTCGFIKRNAAYIDAIKSINTLHLIAGTDIFDNPGEYSLRPLPDKDWHYQWETIDGNTYMVRKRRVEELLGLCSSLGIKVLETNIQEGKECREGIIEENALQEQLEEWNRSQSFVRVYANGNVVKLKRGFSKHLLLSCCALFATLYMCYFWAFMVLYNKVLLGGKRK
jgi:radical SAM superfamily enzyme YgiQ (UPF0313 family)